MTDDNIIKLQNVKDIHIPEIQNRQGTVTLHYGGDAKYNDDEHESVEIKGTITLSEVCFLHALLGRFIMDKMGEP